MSGSISIASAARVLAVALVLGLVLFGEIPGRSLWARDLANFAHGPALAIVTLLVLQLLHGFDARDAPLSQRYWLAIAIVVPLAATIELLQLLLNRDASFADLRRDALGIGAAIAFSTVHDRRLADGKRGRAARTGSMLIGLVCCAMLVAPLLVTVAAYVDRERRFPVLVDFDSPTSLYFVATYGNATVERATLPAMVGGVSDTVALHVQVGNDLPWGVALWEPRPDWRGYRTISLEIVNPTDDRLVAKVRVRDRQPDQRRRKRDIGSVEVPPHTRKTAKLALPRGTEVQQDTALPDIGTAHGLVLTRSPPSRASRFYVLKVWLE